MEQCIEGTTAARVDGKPEPALSLELMARVARRNCTVLIQGETGAGKEVLARQLHTLSRRRDKPFVPVDCTGLRDTILESQLFGHERGAFTGAERSTLGFVRAADTGTLFLDEIGELSLGLQAKLLRTIQERNVTPLGSVTPIPVDIRIICATHRDLHAMVKSGEFREDLLYRLDVVQVHVPSLRERMGEIPGLVEVLLERIAELYDEPTPSIEPEALRLLCQYEWPGNVRQLRNVLEHAFVFAEGPEIGLEHLPESLLAEASHAPTGRSLHPTVSTLDEIESAHIRRVIDEAGGDRTRAAQWLAIDRRRLTRKIEKYAIDCGG